MRLCKQEEQSGDGKGRARDLEEEGENVVEEDGWSRKNVFS